MKRLLQLAAFFLLALPAAAQTTVFNGIVKDLTQTPVPTGQVSFTLRPGIDTVISGNARFSSSTIFCEIHNPAVISTSGTGTITVVIGTPQTWLAGDKLLFVGTGDSTLNANTVATAYTITGVNSPTSYNFTQSGTHANGAGGTVGGLYASGGTGPCQVMQNTALTPANTSYSVSLWPIFSLTSTFNTYALGSGPIDISTIVPTPGQQPSYSFVDTFTNQTIGGNKIATGLWTFLGGIQIGSTPVAGTILPGSLAIKGPNPWVDVLAFGALCDGVTNDYAALVAAANFAIAQGGILKLPPQACAYTPGLAFTQAIQIMGAVEQGGAGGPPVSSLKYTGTGTALQINNGTSVIFGVHLKNFLINGTAVNNQGAGLVCTYCSQVEVDNVFVTSAASPGFATVYDFSNSGGVTAHSMYADNGGVAVKLVNATNVTIEACQLFQNTIGFLMGGNNVGINVHDCPNIERQDYVVDWDDTNPTATLTFGDNVHFHDNYMLFDGGAGTYPHQQVLHVSNTGTNQLTLRNLVFSDNTLNCPGGTCASAYPFSIAISGTTNANTAVTMTAERNWMCCFSSGGVTANSLAATVDWINNQNLNAFGLPVNTDTNGTANWCVVKYAGATASFCGITANGPILGATTGAFSSTLAAVGVTDTGTATKIKRPYYNQGTALVNGSGALSAGWGTSPSLTVSGYDTNFAVVVGSGTGTPTANPSVTVTFADGAWLDTNPVCHADRGDAATPTAGYWFNQSTTTQVVLTFVGTPVTSTNYTVNVSCGGR